MSDAKVSNLIRTMGGPRIPGGCDECDPYQITKELEPDVFLLTIHHDDWCHVLVGRS